MQSPADISGYVSRGALVLFAAFIPFFFVPGGSVFLAQGKALLASSLIAVAVLAWSLGVFFRTSFVPRHALVAFAALLPIAYAVSALTSGWRSASIVSGLGVHDTIVSASLLFATLFIAAAAFTNSLQGVRWLLRAMLFGVASLMIFQLGRLFFGDQLSFGLFQNQATTAFGSWHDLGIILGLTVIISSLLVRTSVAGSLFWRWVFILGAITSFLLMVVVNMADIWYAFAALCALIVLHTSLRKEEGEGRVVRALLWSVLLISALTLGYFGETVHTYLPGPLKVTAIEVRPSWEGTFAIGQESLGESRTLFFGSGPNSFNRAWALHKPASVNATDFWSFDFNAGVGVVPTAFVTLGAVGLIAWLILSAGFLNSVRRMLRRTQSDELKIALALALSSLFLFIFHLMYAPGFSVSALLFLLLGLYVALSLTASRLPPAIEEEVRPPGAPARRLEIASAALASVLVLAVSGVSLRALASDVMVNRSIINFGTDRSAEAASARIKHALVIWPSNERAHRAAVELGMLRLSDQASKVNSAEAQARLQETLSETIQHGLAAVSIGRGDYQNWLTLAQLYQELAGIGVEGAFEQARSAYASARTENPTNPVPVFRLAQLEALRGNRDEAIALLSNVVQLKPNFAAAYYLGSQLYAEKGQFQEATQAAAAAVELVRQDPLGWYNLGTILYLSGNYRDAAAAYSQAISLTPNYSNAIFMLSLSYAELGEKDVAVSTMMRVLELNPNDPTLPKVIENIKAKRDPFNGLQNVK